MSQHPGYLTARDFFEKLRREYKRFSETPEPDHFANFALTAWHLCEWAQKDSSIPDAARRALPALCASQVIQVCRDLSNGTKHFVRREPPIVVADATLVAAFGEGAYGVGQYSKERIEVTLSDGTVMDWFEIAAEASRLWQQFFDGHPPTAAA